MVRARGVQLVKTVPVVLMVQVIRLVRVIQVVRWSGGQVVRWSGGQMVRAVKVFMIAWVVPDTQIKEEKKQEERVL